MTVLVFGARGQVATALARDPSVQAFGRDQVDVTDPGAIARAFDHVQPDAVINASAYTAVDKAETDRQAALDLNTNAPGEMARHAVKHGVPFLHISTDYVFDGSGDRPWMPGERPNPMNVYGDTKLKGERAVSQAGGAFAVLRTSWVFSETGSNFLKTMLRLGGERTHLSIVADQVGGPTPASQIADAALCMVKTLKHAPEKAGTYHFSGAPDVSWAGFARTIFDQARMQVQVTEIETSAYPTPAQRPLNSRLDCQSTLQTFAIERPDWRMGITACLQELGMTK